MKMPEWVEIELSTLKTDTERIAFWDWWVTVADDPGSHHKWGRTIGWALDGWVAGRDFGLGASSE